MIGGRQNVSNLTHIAGLLMIRPVLYSPLRILEWLLR